MSYSQAALSASAGSSNAASGATANSGRKDPIAGFEDAMKRENRDLGKADNQVSLLCMLVGNESDASLPGPGHAVRANYKSDTGGELLSWLLGLYDAFRVSRRLAHFIPN